MRHLRSLIPYLQPYRRPMLAGMLLVVVSNAFAVGIPWLLRASIDLLESPEVTTGRIAMYAGLIVLFAVVGGAARFGMREFLNGVSRRMECDLRAAFFAHLLTLDASFFAKERTGDIMSRATNDTLAVRQAIGPAVMYSVNTAVMSVFALTLMLLISPRLTAFALIPMIVLPPVVVGFGRVIHRRFQTIQEQFAAVSTQVQENLTGVRVVRAYVQEADQSRRFEEMNREYMRRNLHLVKVEGLLHPTLGLLTGAAMVIVVWVGGGLVAAGDISVGDLVAIVFYLNLLAWPMIALGWVINLFQRGEASMARISEMMATRPQIQPSVGTAPRILRGAIEFRDVSFRYPGTERLVLNGVSFTAEAGQTVAVVGPTGSGKSTLVNLIPRLYDPTSGAVLLDGVPLTEHAPGALRAMIGMVPQDTFLFSETIESNVGLGIEGLERGSSADDGVDGRVIEAAEIAQLHEQIMRFPARYGTRLGERGINLSGGQKQRAALARALARDPTILILDDALSAVDTHTEARILSELRNSLRTRTAFIISHRVTAVMDADHILVLDEGRIVEAGTHEELLALDGLYAALLHRQLLEQSLSASA